MQSTPPRSMGEDQIEILTIVCLDHIKYIVIVTPSRICKLIPITLFQALDWQNDSKYYNHFGVFKISFDSFFVTFHIYVFVIILSDTILTVHIHTHTKIQRLPSLVFECKK